MSVYDSFDEQKKFACRVIADHARATAFSIADGILPGNEGRNYVLRKIMRRAIYQGHHALGITDAFFYKVTNFVVDQMGEAYPELEGSREFIEKMVKLEEERFGSTMIVGLQNFERKEEELKSNTVVGTAVSITSEDREFFGWRLEDEGWDDSKKTFVLGKANPNPSRNIIEYVSLDESSKVVGAKLTKPDGTTIYVPREKFPPLAEQEVVSQIEPRISLLRMSEGRVLDANKLIKSVVPLYDTFGTPRDLIRVKLEELGLGPLDEETFNEIFDQGLKELQQAGAHRPDGSGHKDFSTYTSLVDDDLIKSKFVGYKRTKVEDALVRAVIKGTELVASLAEGEEGEVVLDETPFYAESGGQVGDVGRLLNPPAHAGGTDLIASVEDTYSPAQGLIVHKVKVEKGNLKVGDVVTAEVDVEKRDATRRNHTATHLMHAALREVLGTHVKQAGSVVAPNYLRFDFSHYQPLTQSEIDEIERLVNYHILRNEPVQIDEMSIEEAMRSGAMALFGEKYGEKVRVLSIKGAEDIFSKELCGGTHVRATGDIGVFKITSDESIASGVRRIRAVTGVDAYERFREDEEIIGQVTSNLRTSRAELPAMIGKLQDELKKARREADELRLKIATGTAGSASSNGDDAREVNGVRVLAREASGLDANGMRQLSDTLLARIKSGVVVVGRSNDGKASLIVRTSDDLTKKIPAGQVIKELAPIIGGKGGGKPDMAEGGGNQPEKLAEALAASFGVIERMLG
jgi:alanyl-tRNA synthetase